MSIATYSFLPYLRQGIANSLKNTGGSRGVYTVNLKAEGDGGAIFSDLSPRDVELYGPGDIVGIDVRGVLKTDPLNWITNFEPNYVAYIDFYDEDFPWRYTPLEPEAAHRLKPWLALVVLKEGEFEEGKNLLNRPLSYFTLKGVSAENIFPKANQLWAWAHVHVNKELVNKTLEDDPSGMESVLDNLQNALNDNPDCAYSRLICPRKLDENTKYHAFLIPAFESGRLAGIGDTPENISAAGPAIAWDGASPAEFPIYYRWQFNTGSTGDFEYLVRLLTPKPADLRVGRRDMDMTKPGANLEWEEAPDLDLEGILRLGGALQVPRKTLPQDEKDKLDTLDGWGADRLPHPFQKQIAAFLNLADDYSYQAPEDANTNAELPIDPNDDADPLITPPIYGRWHAMIERVLTDRDDNPIHHDYNWINELNLDPRYRVPAHFGTRVIQENQEEYMDAAWKQVGDVLKAIRQIRFAQMAQAAAGIWHEKYLKDMAAVNPEKAFMITAPVQSRILMDSSTVFHTVRESVLPNAVVSAPMRRITRPRGRFIKDLKQKTPGGDFRPEALVGKLSTGEIVVSPPKVIAPELPSATEVGTNFEPATAPGILLDWLRKMPWLPWLIIVLAVVLLIILLLLNASTLAWGIGLVVTAAAIYFFRLLQQWKKSLQVADSIKPENQKPDVVDNLPKSSDFRLEPIGSNFQPSRGGNTDSKDAILFKAGLKDVFEMVEVTRTTIPEPKPFNPISVSQVTDLVIEKLDPEVTIPKWTWAQIQIPEWIRAQLSVEFFTEPMAYPIFDLPMYKPLADISSELLLPNINLIEYNSITLLETNQKFIEAYMVGLNHEMARELLWREYPTDQRGSYFRQFWDVSTLLKTDDADHAGKTEEQIREMYRDIPKLHLWSKFSDLGSHDHRQKPGKPATEEVVLVIRGELLKKYPNTVVYAHKAVWENKSDTDSTFDKTKARDLYKPAEGDAQNPSFDIIRTPLYKAEVKPDITFFGFKLDIEEAKGDSDPETPTLQNAGWFFVLKEIPGEPRFGFDVPKADVDDDPNLTWNDISWTEVLPGSGVIDVNPAPPVDITHPIPGGTQIPDGFQEQHDEDIQIKWNTNGKQVDAADLAYILYQVPVLVAVHASEMLPKTD
ncbi:MAG: hypothetical protein H6557_11600 [Lewinellaceae bacterium]|nr:hypothetical protein [Lewinellaceae bacterium]